MTIRTLYSVIYNSAGIARLPPYECDRQYHNPDQKQSNVNAFPKPDPWSWLISGQTRCFIEC